MIRLGRPPQETDAEAPQGTGAVVVQNNGHEVPGDQTIQPRRKRTRPLLVVCKSRQDKVDILANTKNLAAIEKFKKIFVKKDQTPHERKEWTRLKEVFKREKKRPQNAGMEVKIDYRSKSIKVGDRIVEKGNFRLGPEW